MNESTDRIRNFLELKIRHPNYSNRVLEDMSGLPPNNNPGNRGKKLWRRYIQSELSIDQFLTTCKDFYIKQASSQVISKHTAETIVTNVINNDERSWFEDGDTAVFKGKTTRSIRTLDDAIKFSNADMSRWEVASHRFNSWDVTMKVEEIQVIDGKETKVLVPTTLTNYGVEVKFKPRVESFTTEQLEDYAKLVLNRIVSVRGVPKTKRIGSGTGVGVLNLADLHIGARVSQMVITPDFNVGILIEYLDVVAETVNSHNFTEVYINMVGDYFESISGLNHFNTFKSLDIDMYGSNVMIVAAGILSDFIGKIHNVVRVNMISGNHDRITPKADVDSEGSGAAILAYILGLKLRPNIPVFHHSHIMTVEIDNIAYMLTHGHHSMNKQPIGEMIIKFSNPNIYTLWLSGHIHTRKTRKSLSQSSVAFEGYDAVLHDELRYRKISLPSLFTGNFYSETLGYSTVGGFVITKNNGAGKPHVFDYSF